MNVLQTAQKFRKLQATQHPEFIPNFCSIIENHPIYIFSGCLMKMDERLV
jgi:hypothetical protein